MYSVKCASLRTTPSVRVILTPSERKNPLSISVTGLLSSVDSTALMEEFQKMNPTAATVRTVRTIRMIKVFLLFFMILRFL